MSIIIRFESKTEFLVTKMFKFCDKQEKKEIKKVLKNLLKMVKDFMTGRADTLRLYNIERNLRYLLILTVI